MAYSLRDNTITTKALRFIDDYTSRILLCKVFDTAPNPSLKNGITRYKRSRRRIIIHSDDEGESQAKKKSSACLEAGAVLHSMPASRPEISSVSDLLHLSNAHFRHVESLSTTTQTLTTTHMPTTIHSPIPTRVVPDHRPVPAFVRSHATVRPPPIVQLPSTSTPFVYGQEQYRHQPGACVPSTLAQIRGLHPFTPASSVSHPFTPASSISHAAATPATTHAPTSEPLPSQKPHSLNAKDVEQRLRKYRGITVIMSVKTAMLEAMISMCNVIKTVPLDAESRSKLQYSAHNLSHHIVALSHAAENHILGPF